MFFLFKLILFFFLFLFVLGFLSLIVLRYKVKKFLKKNGAGFTNQSSQRNQRQQGEVWVEDKRDSSQSASGKLKDIGDYVDYEEVKD